MRARFLTVDGCDASGTTHHADALAAALRSHGFAARAYHHPKHPPGCVGVARVAWYMGARAQMLADDEREAATARALGDRTPRVIVLDRGPMSGVVHAESLHSSDPGRVAARRLAAEEREREPWRSAPTAVLDADDEVLDARLAARGERPADSWGERWAWARVAGRARVDTGRDADVVRAELLAWALREVGR